VCQNLQQDMNLILQKIFSKLYSPTQTGGNLTGASSVSETYQLRDKIVGLFEKYKISSIFDAGCNDCNWMKRVGQFVQYQGGDISLAMVADAWRRHPELDIVLHDVTTDPIPKVDLLFVRDVAIHLNNQDRLKLWKNWYDSSVPWILITHIQSCLLNNDIDYITDQFPFSAVNWELGPWNFPKPTDLIDEYGPKGRCLALWHRDQFKEIL
jgi:hypothetical protein